MVRFMLYAPDLGSTDIYDVGNKEIYSLLLMWAVVKIYTHYVHRINNGTISNDTFILDSSYKEKIEPN